MRLLGGNSADLMRAWDGEAPQVVYLDPMFPHRDKSALVKKEMRLFRPLVGDDLDAPALLQAALAPGQPPGGGEAPAQGADHRRAQARL